MPSSEHVKQDIKVLWEALRRAKGHSGEDDPILRQHIEAVREVLRKYGIAEDWSKC